jgi:hypothetical protein
LQGNLPIISLLELCTKYENSFVQFVACKGFCRVTAGGTEGKDRASEGCPGKEKLYFSQDL